MATRGIVHPEEELKKIQASANNNNKEAKEGGGGRKRKISSSDGSNETIAPAPKKTKSTPAKKASKEEGEQHEPNVQKPPRALLAMYKQVLSHPDYTTVIDKANPTIINELGSRYKNQGPEGPEVFESSRKHNRLLRCVWKFLHQKDPVLLEEAIQLVTPKPKKAPASKKVVSSDAGGGEEEGGDGGDEDDDEGDDE